MTFVADTGYGGGYLCPKAKGMELFGYVAAVAIGLSLGLIGGGGSVLTVPVLVYLLNINPVLATAYSLWVVGTTSLVGSVRLMQAGQVHYRAAVVFAVPSLTAVYLTRRFLVPSIPDTLLTVGDFALSKNTGIMVFFALVMLAAALSMLRGRREGTAAGPVRFNVPLIAVEGAVVGLLTGVVGAGGGFLIIPALVLLARLPMKTAVGTSLLIIAVKSLIGFLGDVGQQPIDWRFLTVFTGLSVVGIFVGSSLSKRIPGEQLKKGFGWLVLAMAGYILVKELLL